MLNRCVEWGKMAAKVSAPHEPLKRWETLDGSLSWLFTQYRGHQKQWALRLFTCFTIVMIRRGHSLLPPILFTSTFSFYMVTACLCIYKLCSSCMFATISSDCKTQHISSLFISQARMAQMNQKQNGDLRYFFLIFVLLPLLACCTVLC